MCFYAFGKCVFVRFYGCASMVGRGPPGQYTSMYIYTYTYIHIYIYICIHTYPRAKGTYITSASSASTRADRSFTWEEGEMNEGGKGSETRQSVVVYMHAYMHAYACIHECIRIIFLKKWPFFKPQTGRHITIQIDF